MAANVATITLDPTLIAGVKPSFISRSACPCCGAAYSNTDDLVEGNLNNDLSLEDLLNGWVGLNRRSFFSYRRCTDCKTLSTPVYPSGETLAQLYSYMPPNMNEAVSKQDQQKNQDQYAEIITRCLKQLGAVPDHLSMLELGADCGLLASGISQLVNTSGWHYSAVEPNDAVRAELSKTLQQAYASHELHLDAKEISTEDPKRLFSIIAAVHVFDHIFSIEELLHLLKGILSKNGFIFFVVHNPESTLAKALGTRWPPFCAQHPQLFTIRGVRALADRAGLEVVDFGRTMNHFPLRMIGDFIGIHSTGLENLSLQAPLGNRFYILMNKEPA